MANTRAQFENLPKEIKQQILVEAIVGAEGSKRVAKNQHPGFCTGHMKIEDLVILSNPTGTELQRTVCSLATTSRSLRALLPWVAGEAARLIREEEETAQLGYESFRSRAVEMLHERWVAGQGARPITEQIERELDYKAVVPRRWEAWKNAEADVVAVGRLRQ